MQKLLEFEALSTYLGQKVIKTGHGRFKKKSASKFPEFWTRKMLHEFLQKLSEMRSWRPSAEPMHTPFRFIDGASDVHILIPEWAPISMRMLQEVRSQFTAFLCTCIIKIF